MGDAGRVSVPEGGTAFSAGGKEEDDAPASRGVCRLRECFYLDRNRVLLEKRRDEGSANGRKRVIHHGSSKARLFLSTGDMVELGKERSRYERNSLLLLTWCRKEWSLIEIRWLRERAGI